MGRICELLVELDEERLMDAIREELAGGTDAAAVFIECQEGLSEIGRLFQEEKMFVSDLMMAGVLFKDIVGLIMPHMKTDGGAARGKVVLGTVKDDIHDIGKDIVASMLAAAGFDVIDLGVDVPPEEFVRAVRENNVRVLALSCLLASCYASILNTVEAVKAAGIREKVKILIGGGPVDEHVVRYSGADAYGATAQDAVDYCKEALR
ncbi:MAG: cobalamin-dependent protein [Clostridiales Family XIII bacterium]|jgi:methylmalonyl-CoA mutase cobalamin-binding domain/chain|nr:cobalamin-dependent protein [Clostridiales Family XIII bacterium]